MKIRTLIIDDEPLARRLISKMLKADHDFEVIGECENGQDALEQIPRLQPDLVFLDIQMPEIDGFDLLRRLNLHLLPIIIFVTAYDKYALQAFVAHALDYLLKPIAEDHFRTALQRVKTYRLGKQINSVTERLSGLLQETPVGPRSQPKTISRLVVRSGGSMIFLRIGEIDYIESAGNYLTLHVGVDRHLIRGRLREMEKNLDPQQFFRIHRTTIVNLDRVREFKPLFKGEGVVVLKNGASLPASRSCSSRLQETLGSEL